MIPIRVSVVVALAAHQEVVDLELPQGSSAVDAVLASRIAERFPQLGGPPWLLGIWSKPCEPSAMLRDGDRVEVYRGLAADPKDQRRTRARLKPSTRSRSGS